MLAPNIVTGDSCCLTSNSASSHTTMRKESANYAAHTWKHSLQSHPIMHQTPPAGFKSCNVSFYRTQTWCREGAIQIYKAPLSASMKMSSNNIPFTTSISLTPSATSIVIQIQSQSLSHINLIILDQHQPSLTFRTITL